jgi:hypothetical protein
MERSLRLPQVDDELLERGEKLSLLLRGEALPVA